MGEFFPLARRGSSFRAWPGNWPESGAHFQPRPPSAGSPIERPDLLAHRNPAWDWPYGAPLYEGQSAETNRTGQCTAAQTRLKQGSTCKSLKISRIGRAVNLG